MLLKANSFQKKIIPSLLSIPSELLPNFFSVSLVTAPKNPSLANSFFNYPVDKWSCLF